jgi:hypothetical protein
MKDCKQHRSQAGDDSEQNLVALCAACHAKVHREQAEPCELSHAALPVLTGLPFSRCANACELLAIEITSRRILSSIKL